MTSRADVETIEHHISCEHDCDDAEPESWHDYFTPHRLQPVSPIFARSALAQVLARSRDESGKGTERKHRVHSHEAEQSEHRVSAGNCFREAFHRAQQP